MRFSQRCIDPAASRLLSITSTPHVRNLEHNRIQGGVHHWLRLLPPLLCAKFGQLFHTSRFIRLWFSSYVHMTFAPVFLEILRSASAETISFSTCHVLIFWSVMVSDLLIVRTRLCHLELRFCTKLLQFCLGSSNYGLLRQSRSHPSDVLSNGYYAVWDSAMLRMLALLHGSTLKAIFWLPLSDQHSIASGHNEILSITDLVAAFTQ